MHEDEAAEPSPEGAAPTSADPSPGAPVPPPPRRSILDILTEPRRRPTTPPGTAGSETSAGTKVIVDGLDGLEQGLGFASVCFAVLLAIVSYFAAKHSSTKSIHDSASFLLISNLVFAGILALGLALKRRALLGFGCFFYGLEEAFSYHSLILGLPFLALGGWLIVRANRKQRLERASSAPRSAGRSAKPATRGPSNPKASKRYTPPRKASASRRR